MPLPYEISKDLHIPEAAFDSDGIAVIQFDGGRFGSHHAVAAFAVGVRDFVGKIEIGYDTTNPAEGPTGAALVAETTRTWLQESVKALGLQVLTWEDHNLRRPRAERQFFQGARAAIGKESQS